MNIFTVSITYNSTQSQFRHVVSRVKKFHIYIIKSKKLFEFVKQWKYSYLVSGRAKLLTISEQIHF